MLIMQTLMGLFSSDPSKCVLDLQLTILRKRIFPSRLPSAEQKFANAKVMEAALNRSADAFLIDSSSLRE